jgi:hypothetical protein
LRPGLDSQPRPARGRRGRRLGGGAQGGGEGRPRAPRLRSHPVAARSQGQPIQRRCRGHLDTASASLRPGPGSRATSRGALAGRGTEGRRPKFPVPWRAEPTSPDSAQSGAGLRVRGVLPTALVKFAPSFSPNHCDNTEITQKCKWKTTF